MQLDNKHIDDLDYLAGLGYAEGSVTEVDLDDLNKRLKARTGQIQGGLWVTGSMTVLFLSVTLVFPVLNREIIYPTFAEQQIPENYKSSLVDSLQEIMLDTVKVAPENFTKPLNPALNQQTGSIVVAEPMASDSLQVMSLPSREITSYDSLKENNLKLKFLINSPVTYIHNLKVTDYRRLYYKILVKDELTGLPATLAAYETTDGSGKRLKTYAENYLHEDLAKALLYFKKEKYEDCISMLYRIAKYNENDVNCSFYLGMCFYNQKKFDRALVYFNECLNQPNNAFNQEAGFYKALSLLETGKAPEGKALLSQIKEDGGFYAEKAGAKLN